MFEIKPRTSILVVRTDCVLTGLICWYVLVEVVESQVWLALCGVTVVLAMGLDQCILDSGPANTNHHTSTVRDSDTHVLTLDILDTTTPWTPIA